MQLGLDFGGGDLVGLVAELERRLIGSAPSPGLPAEIADVIPTASTYVLVVFDGLGVAQLGHEAAEPLRASHAATLQAPFPTTTSVALATIATGLAPAQHGLIAHLVRLEDLGKVVNTLKWVDLSGASVAYDYAAVLPRPNLWERLRGRGIEPITVQPVGFTGSPLSRLLYRGARFEGVFDDHELVQATIQLSREPGRLILVYVWQIDFAGHVSGLESSEMRDAVRLASNIWEGLATGLSPDVALLGTADHGLIEYGEADKILIRDPHFDGLTFWGDPRGVHLAGDSDRFSELAELTGGSLADPVAMLGSEPSPRALSRVGDALLLAPEGRVILPRGFDKRLRGYHGGLAPAECEIPLLVG